jgi:EAL domain-containing protein (putative c-di-GMP-specific phosphodiesterase class I)
MMATIVASIVALGRALSMDITAEGVETADQVTLLKASGCNMCRVSVRSSQPQRRCATSAAADEPRQSAQSA